MDLTIANQLLLIHVGVLISFSCSHSLPTFLLYISDSFTCQYLCLYCQQTHQLPFFFLIANETLPQAQQLVPGPHFPILLL